MYPCSEKSFAPRWNYLEVAEVEMHRESHAYAAESPLQTYKEPGHIDGNGDSVERARHGTTCSRHHIDDSDAPLVTGIEDIVEARHSPQQHHRTT